MFKKNKLYGRGTRTFWVLFFNHGKTFTFISIALFYFAWAIYFGSLGGTTDVLLSKYSDLYIDRELLARWVALAAISTLFVAFLEVYVFFREVKFRLDDHSLHVRRGIFFIKETSVPYRHIQNVDLEQPYHYRLLGLARLDIITNQSNDESSTKHRKFAIPLIDSGLAKKLAKFLIHKGVESNTYTPKKSYNEIIEEEYGQEGEFADEYDEPVYEVKVNK